MGLCRRNVIKTHCECSRHISLQGKSISRAVEISIICVKTNFQQLFRSSSLLSDAALHGKNVCPQTEPWHSYCVTIIHSLGNTTYIWALIFFHLWMHPNGAVNKVMDAADNRWLMPTGRKHLVPPDLMQPLLLTCRLFRRITDPGKTATLSEDPTHSVFSQRVIQESMQHFCFPASGSLQSPVFQIYICNIYFWHNAP